MDGQESWSNFVGVLPPAEIQNAAGHHPPWISSSNCTQVVCLRVSLWTFFFFDKANYPPVLQYDEFWGPEYETHCVYWVAHSKKAQGLKRCYSNSQPKKKLQKCGPLQTTRVFFSSTCRNSSHFDSRRRLSDMSLAASAAPRRARVRAGAAGHAGGASTEPGSRGSGGAWVAEVARKIKRGQTNICGFKNLIIHLNFSLSIQIYTSS